MHACMEQATAGARPAGAANSAACLPAWHRRAVAVQGVQYSLRATTARYRYLALPEMRALMKDVSEALRVL